jgi:hypothetical protein
MSSRRKSFAKSKWLAAAAFTLFLWGACAFLIRQATRKLTDLTKISAVLDSVSIEQGSGRTRPYYVVFNLKQSTERPGIYFGQGLENANKLALQFKLGDEVTIYYDATGMNAERNINLHVYQVQSKDRVIYSLNEAQNSNETGAYWAGSLALLSTVLFIVVYNKEAKRKAWVRKEIAKL